ncbi:MAG: uroporphyrinogen decarboxylase family protein [Limnochordia bacterium]
MQQTDVQRHNEDVQYLWEEFHRGNPSRVPVLFMMNPRLLLMDPAMSEGVSFADYFADPQIMLETQLRFHKWRRLSVWADWEMGLPKDRWDVVVVDYQNTGEGAWFGCDIDFTGGMPRCVPFLQDKRELLHLEIEDPILGRCPQIWEAYQHINGRVAQGWEYEGAALSDVASPFAGTDGPFTVAVQMRGATEVCMDLYEDPGFVHDLLDFITTQTIRRILAWGKATGHSYPVEGWYFADDCIQYLSLGHYREFVLPYHKRLVEALSRGKNKIHLCGKVQHLLPTVRDELDIDLFNLGYPTDMGKLRKDLGPDVELQGNISPMLLYSGSPEAIVEAAKTLLESGVTEGRRFLLCDGHNIVPHTPLENLAAMYEAGKRYGRYS